MELRTVVIARDPATCWRLFVDPALLTAWVPGLRRVQVLSKEHGMARDVHFEFAQSRAYTLTYSYLIDDREVRWQPKLGRRDGVAGFARFTAVDAGTELTYGLQQGSARTPEERTLGGIDQVVASLRSWLVAHP